MRVFLLCLIVKVFCKLMIKIRPGYGKPWGWGGGGGGGLSLVSLRCCRVDGIVCSQSGLLSLYCTLARACLSAGALVSGCGTVVEWRLLTSLTILVFLCEPAVEETEQALHQLHVT